MAEKRAVKKRQSSTSESVSIVAVFLAVILAPVVVGVGVVVAASGDLYAAGLLWLCAVVTFGVGVLSS